MISCDCAHDFCNLGLGVYFLSFPSLRELLKETLWWHFYNREQSRLVRLSSCASPIPCYLPPGWVITILHCFLFRGWVIPLPDNKVKSTFLTNPIISWKILSECKSTSSAETEAQQQPAASIQITSTPQDETIWITENYLGRAVTLHLMSSWSSDQRGLMGI